MRIKQSTILLLFAFSFLLSFSLRAQTWVTKQQGIATSFIERMWFTSSTTGYATLGENTGGIGSVLKTTDAGASWTKIPTSCSNATYDVNFTSANTGFTCSFNGEIGKTTNAGVNWTEVYQNGSNNYLYTLGFFDANTGFSAGFAYFVRTTNAGASWSEGAIAGNQYSNAVLTSTKAYLCGSSTGADGGVWLSTNTGASWTYTQLSASSIFYDIDFVDANTGYVCGASGTMYKTINGGTNWTALTTGTTNSLTCVQFYDANTGFIAGSSGGIFKTTNGGTSFTQSTIVPAPNTTIYDIIFLDASNYLFSTSNGALYRTSDAGVTWYTIGNNNLLNSVCFPDAMTGYTVGANSIIQKTTDGGNNWALQTPPSNSNLNSVDFPSVNTGYAAGILGTLIKTTNGGTNWTALTTGITTQIFSIDFLDENTGYFTTTAGAVRMTTNGGANWTVLATGVATNMTGIYFLNTSTGFVTTTAGGVRKTTNSGTNWTAINTGSTQQMNCVHFLDENTGYVSGNSGSIYKTTNSGTNWTLQTTGTTNSLTFVRFGSVNSGIAVGNLGTIIVTTNGGTNWTIQTSNTTQALRSIGFSSSNSIFVVGGNGTILNSTDQVLPVELASFTSNVNGRNVTLNWKTVSEMNNSGFEVQRSYKDDDVWIKMGFVAGGGTVSSERSYLFEDKNLASGKYRYRLKQIDFNGNFEYKNLSNEVIVGKPNTFTLEQNYPNPFNPSTKINFEIPVDGNVTLKIFDISGKEVITLIDGFKAADYYTVNFDAKSLPSGIYFAKLSSESKNGGFMKTIKMIMSK